MNEIRDRHRRQIALRVLILLGCLGVLAVQAWDHVFPELAGARIPADKRHVVDMFGPSALAMWVIIAGLGLYIVSYLTNLVRVPLAQLLIDFVLLVSMVALTGGVHSIFVPIYFGLILAVAFVARPSGAIWMALLASVVQVAIWGAYENAYANEVPALWGAVNPIYLRTQEFWLDVGVLLAQLVGFAVIGAMGFVLASRQAQERVLYEEILHNLADGVVTLDRLGAVLFVNDRGRHLMGVQYDAEVVGRPLHDVIPLENRRPLQLLRDQREYCEEVALLNNYGERIPAEITTSLLFDHKRELRGVIGILSDLQMRNQLDLAVKRADRLQAVGDLAAAIAHELRNPLASIRGCVQELRTETGLSSDMDGMMKIAIGESDRLDGIITEFLQFARLPRAQVRDVPLDALLDDVRLQLDRHESGRAPVQLDMQRDLHVRADPGQLRQLLLNLGLNAIQASAPEDPVVLRARRESLLRSVSYDAQAGRERAHEIPGVRIEVVDQGRGIPAEVRSRLFDPFFTTKPRGTGMGLAMVNRIVEEHHGVIRVTSQIDEGSTFVVWLPTDPDEVAGLRLSGASGSGG